MLKTGLNNFTKCPEVELKINKVKVLSFETVTLNTPFSKDIKDSLITGLVLSQFSPG